MSGYTYVVEARDFRSIYANLCSALLAYGDDVGNTKELRNVQIHLEDINTATISSRQPSAGYALAELCWYLTASRDVQFIGQHGSLWSKISDDGCTSNSAYGYIIHKAEGFDQLEKIIELLKRDQNSRRAVINLNKANPYVIETKDEPCTIALQFTVRDQKVCCTAMMRSNDIRFGLPYDIIYFTTLQKIVADRLGLEYGSYTHFAVSMHAYHRDLEKVETYAQNLTANDWAIDHKKLMEYAKAFKTLGTKETLTDVAMRKKVLVTV